MLQLACGVKAKSRPAREIPVLDGKLGCELYYLRIHGVPNTELPASGSWFASITAGESKARPPRDAAGRPKTRRRFPNACLPCFLLGQSHLDTRPNEIIVAGGFDE